MKQQLSLFAIILFSYFSGFSQVNDIAFSHLGLEDGLSQSAVKCILKDSEGFLWVGTGDGLNKFDGYEFTIYRHNQDDPNSIGGNDIECIYEDPRDSTLWIGTQGGGLNRYDRKHDRFVCYRYESNNPVSLGCDDVRAIIKGAEGALWVGTYGGGIYQLIIEQGYFYPIRNSENSLQNDKIDFVDAFAECLSGGVWVGGVKGIFKLKEIPQGKGTATLESFIWGDNKNIHNVRSILEEEKGVLWLGTFNNGLYRIQLKNDKVNHFCTESSLNYRISDNKVRTLKRAKDGKLWVGTYNGLNVWDSESETFIVTRHDPLRPSSLSCNKIYSLYEDDAGIMWIGTSVGGLNKYDRFESKFSLYRNLLGPGTDYSENDVRSLCVDHDNELWIGTTKGLIQVLRDSRGKVQEVKMNPFFKGKGVGCIYQFAPGRMLLSGGGKIMQYNKITGALSSFSDKIRLSTGVDINAAQTIINDKHGNVYLGTQKGLLKFDIESDQFKLYRKWSGNTPGLSDELILGLCEDNQGLIWIGTSKGGLNRFDPQSGTFQHFLNNRRVASTISSNKVYSIVEGEPGILWIGTNRGLNRYDIHTRIFTSYRGIDGFANEVIYGVLKDSQGNIWGSTNGGLFVFDPKSEHVRNYNFKDGLQSNEFNQNAYCVSPRGELAFGGIKGVNAFFPDHIKDNPFIPPVVLTGFELFYRPVKVGQPDSILERSISHTKQIILNHRQSVFSIEFTALNYTSPENNQYKYMLEGYDDGWINVGTQRMASYTNLNPGSYVFKVKGANNDGIWNENATQVSITVMPPFWKTYWFRGLLIMVVVLIIYTIFYFRMKEMRNKKQVLEALVTEKTNELMTQKSALEISNEQLQGRNHEILKQKEKIEKKNKELGKQHDQIIQQRDELIHLTQQVREATQAKLRFFTNISHEFRTPLTLIVAPIKQLLSQWDLMDANAREYKLKLIHGNSSKLLFLINQILDFRKVENDKVQIRVHRGNIVSFVEEIFHLFDDLAQRRNTEFQYIVSEKVPQLWYDSGKMEKIIYNLLSNAFKFTPKGGRIAVRIDVSNPEESGDTNWSVDNSQYIRISVEDSGVGIPENQIDNVFDRFFQVKNIKHHESLGSGIGLALVKKYMDLHHGIINVQSEQGKGSCFTLFVPLGKDHFTSDQVAGSVSDIVGSKELMEKNIQSLYPALAYQSSNKSSDDGKHKSKKLLLVEDNDELREYLRDLLCDEYSIFEASDGQQGINMAKDNLPDIIVSDVMMPVVDGYEFCEKIKTNIKTSHIPFVMLTALSGTQPNIQGLESGADAYIPKPFDPHYLTTTIKKLIETRELLKEKFSKGLVVHPQKDVKSSMDSKFLDNAIKQLDKKIGDSDFGVDDFCKVMNMSQTQLYRKLKGLTGLTINEFIRNGRLKMAAQLLMKGELNINQVAFEVGFNDPNYFGKCFHKLYQQTPSDFMKSSNA